MGDLKLGYNTGYWSSGPPKGALEAVQEAERLGFNSVWTAEAYGSDALTPLAWWGAATETMQLGTAIMQMSARTPAAAAMAAITMDHLSNGRFILGLGASGPQVVEGWYGQPYPKPLARTREYVEIVRRIIAREEPVEFHGDFYDLPFDGGANLGKALHVSALAAPSVAPLGHPPGHFKLRYGDWQEENQAAYVDAAYTLLFAQPEVEAITWWCPVDGRLALVPGGGLLRQDLTPKPAYVALQDWMRRHTTHGQTYTDDEGRVVIRGYAGDYDVQIIADGGGRRASYRIEARIVGDVTVVLSHPA